MDNMEPAGSAVCVCGGVQDNNHERKKGYEFEEEKRNKEGVEGMRNREK